VGGSLRATGQSPKKDGPPKTGRTAAVRKKPEVFLIHQEAFILADLIFLQEMGPLIVEVPGKKIVFFAPSYSVAIFGTFFSMN